MQRKDFYFPLPEDRIARFPSEKRDQSKLMVVERGRGKISHGHFKDIVHWIGGDDFVVFNDSGVMPVKFFGKIDGKTVEILVAREIDEYLVEAFSLPARKFRVGVEVCFGDDLRAEVVGIGEGGLRRLRFNRDFASALKGGYAPLPPYIKRKFPEAREFRSFDLDRYQTVYARHPGSIAAPTAGLHFTGELLEKIGEHTEVIEITLDVGPATFQRIEVQDLGKHKMGREYIAVQKSAARKIEKLRNRGKKLVAVGTTTVRALETLAILKPEKEQFYSELFISPGFRFQMVDKLITNFHLPESSLFILVSAFAGLPLMKEAYRVAVEEGYRFFSYGDAMLIV